MKLKSHQKIGLPIIGITLAGSYLLSIIYSFKLEVKNEKKDLRITKREKFDLQKVYFDLMKKDLDDWDYKPLNRD